MHLTNLNHNRDVGTIKGFEFFFRDTAIIYCQRVFPVVRLAVSRAIQSWALTSS